jgi:hypothetical protein
MRFHQFQRYLVTHVPFYWIPKLLLRVLFLPGIMIQPVNAQNLDQNMLLVNAQGHFYQGSKKEIIAAQDPPIQPEVTRFKLNDLSGVSEWIRVEVTGNQVKLLHTVVTQSGLSKGITRLTMLPIAVNHTWYDHETFRTIFRPNTCQSSECLIAGVDSVLLPAGMTIYDGEFILEYKESGWIRTITFKVPPKSPKPPSTSARLARQVQPLAQPEVWRHRRVLPSSHAC